MGVEKLFDPILTRQFIPTVFWISKRSLYIIQALQETNGTVTSRTRLKRVFVTVILDTTCTSLKNFARIMTVYVNNLCKVHRIIPSILIEIVQITENLNDR